MLLLFFLLFRLELVSFNQFNFPFHSKNFLYFLDHTTISNITISSPNFTTQLSITFMYQILYFLSHFHHLLPLLFFKYFFLFIHLYLHLFIHSTHIHIPIIHSFTLSVSHRLFYLSPSPSLTIASLSLSPSLPSLTSIIPSLPLSPSLTSIIPSLPLSPSLTSIIPSSLSPLPHPVSCTASRVRNMASVWCGLQIVGRRVSTPHTTHGMVCPQTHSFILISPLLLIIHDLHRQHPPPRPP